MIQWGTKIFLRFLVEMVELFKNSWKKMKIHDFEFIFLLTNLFQKFFFLLTFHQIFINTDTAVQTTYLKFGLTPQIRRNDLETFLNFFGISLKKPLSRRKCSVYNRDDSSPSTFACCNLCQTHEWPPTNRDHFQAKSPGFESLLLVSSLESKDDKLLS